MDIVSYARPTPGVLRRVAAVLLTASLLLGGAAVSCGEEPHTPGRGGGNSGN